MVVSWLWSVRSEQKVVDDARGRVAQQEPQSVGDLFERQEEKDRAQQERRNNGSEDEELDVEATTLVRVLLVILVWRRKE